MKHLQEGHGAMHAKLGAAQRKMLRKIVGWIRFDDESWETTGQRMKARLKAALQRRTARAWSSVRQIGRQRLLHSVETGSAPVVAQLPYRWTPSEAHGAGRHRQRGRLRQRWRDGLDN